MEVSYENINRLQGRAKMNFRMREHDLAREQAAEAMALFAAYPKDDPEWDTLCTRLGDMMQVFGNIEECDRLMKLALSASSPDGNERGEREAYYAQFLFSQGRLDEAEVHAVAAIRAPVGEVGFVEQLLEEIRLAKAKR